MIIKKIEDCKPAIAVVCCVNGSYSLSYLWDNSDNAIAWELREQAYKLIEAAIDRDYPGMGRYASTIGTGMGIQLSAKDVRPEHKTSAPYTEISFNLIGNPDSEPPELADLFAAVDAIFDKEIYQ